MAKNKRLIQRFLSIQQSGGSTTLPDTISDDFASGFNARWQQAGSAWAVSGGAAICTPALEAELYTNGSFATDTAWTKGAAWTIGSGTADHAATATDNITQNVGTANTWLKCVFSVKSVSGAVATVAPIFGTNANIGIGRATAADGYVSINYRAAGTSQGFRCGSTTVATIDDASVKQITTADMFCSVSGLKNEANISANVTLISDQPAGVIGWLDSHTNPQNYILLFHTGTTLKLFKIVAGVITSLISTTNTYSAGATITLKGTRSGADLLLTAHYNGSQVGTQQTVSDAAIVDNRRHGMFSTSELNSLDNFSVTAYA